MRFIPACTGNIARRTSATGRSAVHPRVYGEYQHPRMTPAASIGSSPRVRGILARIVPPLSPYRFIPACTGNTSESLRRSARHTVHPRVYGEYFLSIADTSLLYGSSPRVRGIRYAAPREITPARFIPACTGNTGSVHRLRGYRTVHPRVYGEYCCVPDALALYTGSSPRVRGIRIARFYTRHGLRFIPACTGNTYRSVSPCGWTAVHPRVYGEYIDNIMSRWDSAGSSPRVRGIRTGAQATRPVRRFIPACTGNTTIFPSGPMTMAVHPRVYGEYI